MKTVNKEKKVHMLNRKSKKYSITQKLQLFLLLLIPLQGKTQSDSAYVRPFPEEFTIRPYLYWKFTSLNTTGKESITYHPNTPVGLGVGFTYRQYALNLAWAPPFLRDKERGKTTYLDLQYHYYSNKYLFDLLFQNYKGFYQTMDQKNEIFELYPDIHVIQYAASGQYVFNHRKFSYKAAFYCNEKQVRSAGSFQLGGGFYYNYLSTDTTQILSSSDRFRNYQASVTGGYVHTFVFRKDYFITIGLSTGINFCFGQNRYANDKFRVTPNLFPRFAMGYNGEKWALTINSVINQSMVTKSGDIDIFFMTGRVNLCYVHRINTSPGFLKKIKPLNR